MGYIFLFFLQNVTSDRLSRLFPQGPVAAKQEYKADRKGTESKEDPKRICDCTVLSEAIRIQVRPTATMKAAVVPQNVTPAAALSGRAGNAPTFSRARNPHRHEPRKPAQRDRPEETRVPRNCRTADNQRRERKDQRNHLTPRVMRTDRSK